LVLLTICAFISQCKKAPANNISSGCLSSTQIDSAGATWLYTFDSQGRLIEDSLVGGSNYTYGSTAYFNYAGNTINVTYALGPEYATITLNAAGLPLSVTTPDGNTCSATYNGDGSLATITSINYSGPCTAVYSGGNLVALTNNGSTVSTFTYYSNVVTVPYDPQAKMFALCGDWTVSACYSNGTNCGYIAGFNPQVFSKNLLQSAYGSNYSYHYDSKGNISYVSAITSYPPPLRDTTVAVAYYSYNCQ
jgi:YD repeat-containing protein